MPSRLTPADRMLRLISERQLQLDVEADMTTAGWALWYHAPDNRPVVAHRTGRSYVQNIRRGFPDLVARDPGRPGRRLAGRLVALELKRQVNSEPTVEQLAWLRWFAELGGFAAVIRPRHLAMMRHVILGGDRWPEVDPTTFEPLAAPVP